MAYDQIYTEIANYLNVSVGVVIVALAIISIWTLIWKGLALWKSAKKNQMIWFVVLLIVNTIGILEILYIYVFSKWSGKKSLKEEKTVKKKIVKKKK